MSAMPSVRDLYCFYIKIKLIISPEMRFEGNDRHFMEMVRALQPEIDAAIKIRRSVQRFARQLRFRRADHGVSGTKRSILGSLFRSEKPLTLTELARIERLQPQSLTRAIAELEEASLIERRQGESDRRQSMISITKTGRELLIADAQSQVDWLLSLMRAHMSKAEQEMLSIAAGLIERICDISDANDSAGLASDDKNRDSLQAN
jgi:DNA-binding MarR family transcriptional regulator